MSTTTPTDLFLSLTPDKVLEAVEAAGLRCNPVCYALNSYENRVYEIELEDDSRVVAKFYRPGRWTEAQLLEEHRFLADLEDAEVPVCPVLPFPDGSTLKKIDHIYYCLFDRRGGRAPDELSDLLVERLGMLAARIHNVGAGREAPHRLRLDADTYIRRNLDWMRARGVLPGGLAPRYTAAAEQIASIADERLRGVNTHRVHGDFHAGNIIERQGLLHVLDFDDCVVGPAIQDVWLILPGRDPDSDRKRALFIDAYEQLRDFDHASLRLIEPLRGMRLVHYSAWLARRWHDPAFPATWPHFGTQSYWEQATSDLEEVLAHMDRQARAESAAPALTAQDEPELTNKDFFWDMED